MMELERSAVYGPIQTRRFGWDLGINLLPTRQKLCTFDCIYCQYGSNPAAGQGAFEFPQLKQILREWQQRLDDCKSKGIAIRHTTISGNGEPTMHPQFAKLIPELVRWRDENAPNVKLAILSNGYRIHDPSICSAMESLDEPIVKLDSAVPEKFQKICRPLVPFSLARFLQQLRKCSRLIVQTMFIRGWNDGLEDLIAWRNALFVIQPAHVQIYTISRDTAVPGLQAISTSELIEIAKTTTELTRIPVQSFA